MGIFAGSDDDDDDGSNGANTSFVLLEKDILTTFCQSYITLFFLPKSHLTFLCEMLVSVWYQGHCVTEKTHQEKDAHTILLHTEDVKNRLYNCSPKL